MMPLLLFGVKDRDTLFVADSHVTGSFYVTVMHFEMDYRKLHKSGGKSMYKVETQEMSDEFSTCWKAAGTHLSKQVDGGIQSWLRAHPYPPFLEHLSFRLGNQLFFIRVEDVDGKIQGPGSLLGLHAAAKSANGQTCH